MAKIRLQKYIRDALGISRRKAEELIAHHRVQVNNKIAELGTVVDTETDNIVIDEKEIRISNLIEYILLNKPAGYLTTRKDTHNRKTIYELLPKKLHYLFPVGRLDLNSEGLLLLTNDGNLAFKLTHPKFEIEKEYEVLILGKLTLSAINKIQNGIHSDLITSAPAKIKVINNNNNQTLLKITLHEGKKREIRLIFLSLGYKVLKLKRIRIKSLHLNNLKSGNWRHLTDKELNNLQT